MKAEQLRKSILQMAIQGKLVPQDPNDEPAAVLLEKIRAEKQRLIKEGKIKKDKAESVIFRGEDNRHYEKVGNNEPVCIEDELPFEIPESWEWIRLGYLISIISGVSYYKKDVAKNGIRILRGGNIQNLQVLTFDDDVFLPTNYKDNEKQVKLNDILIVASTGSKTVIGKAGYINKEIDNTQIGAFLRIVRLLFSELVEYIKLIFATDYYREHIRTQAQGTNINNVKAEYITRLLVPIPPISEQSRIVAEIEKYEPLIAEYDKLEQQKTKLDGEIYDKLKKSILQYAIQGKLIPQDENDEPASELLKRIRAEKKAQPGKKYVDSYIYKGDDNCYYEKIGINVACIDNILPFEIPNTWTWARLDNAVIINPRNNIEDDIDVSFIEMKSLGDSFYNNFNYAVRSWKEVKNGFTHFQNGDVGFAKITPCFQNRKSAVFIDLQNGYGAGTTELHILRPYRDTILAKYLLWFVKSPYFIEYGKQNFSGTAGQQRFGTVQVKSVFIPIPPYNEQRRICKRIKIILDNIKDEV